MHKYFNSPSLTEHVRLFKNDQVFAMLTNGSWENDVNKKCKPAIRTAISKNNIEALQLLLQHGADPNTEIGNHHSCLQLAAESLHDECFNILLRSGANVNSTSGLKAVKTLVSRGNVDLVREAIPYLSHVDKRLKDGQTLLMSAYQHPAMIELLISHGADMNAVVTSNQYTTGYSVLMLCSHLNKGHLPSVQCLVKLGVNVEHLLQYNDQLKTTNLEYLKIMKHAQPNVIEYLESVLEEKKLAEHIVKSQNDIPSFNF